MGEQLSYGTDYKYIPATSVRSGLGTEVVPDLYCHTIQIVNICLVGRPESKEFVLIDAGMPKSADEITSVVEQRKRQIQHTYHNDWRHEKMKAS